MDAAQGGQRSARVERASPVLPREPLSVFSCERGEVVRAVILTRALHLVNAVHVVREPGGHSYELRRSALVGGYLF